MYQKLIIKMYLQVRSVKNVNVKFRKQKFDTWPLIQLKLESNLIFFN